MSLLDLFFPVPVKRPRGVKRVHVMGESPEQSTQRKLREIQSRIRARKATDPQFRKRRCECAAKWRERNPEKIKAYKQSESYKQAQRARRRRDYHLAKQGVASGR